MSAEKIVWNIVDDLTTRVYRSNAPSNPVLPYMLIQLLPSTHESYLGDANAGTFKALFQFDVLSRDQDEAITIIEALRNRLQGYSDADVVVARIVDEQDLSVAPADGSDEWLYRKTARYSIRINEALPSGN